MNWEIVKQRSEIIANIKKFFNGRNYMEVDTPLLSPDLIPESSIEIFKSQLINPFKQNMDLYLVPSPEIWMKKLLSKGSGDIYQICKSFRNSEQSGRIHNSEFTILEWYKTENNYLDNIKETEELFKSLLTKESADYLHPPFRKMSMDEAFSKYAGFSLESNLSIENLKQQAKSLHIDFQFNDNWEELFNRIFIQLIEPSLPQEKPLILYNYPSKIQTMAKTLVETPWSERWELYCGGMELANCFTEESNPKEIAKYFEWEDSIKKDKALVYHKSDKNYCDYFGNTFPKCSGVALGIDRLIMLLSGERSIEGVILFPLSDKISFRN